MEQNQGMPMGVKILIGVIILTGLSVGGYFVYDYVKKPKAPIEPESKTPETKNSPSDYVPSNSGGGGGGSKSSSNSSFPLKKGSKGDNVMAYQQAVNSYYAGYPAKQITADGDFGSKSLAAAQGLFGAKKTQVEQGDVDWLKSHTYKAQQTKTPTTAAPAPKANSLFSEFGL